MIELLLCMAGVLAMAVLAIAPWTFLVQGGAAIALAGLVVGLPTGLAYHVQLRRELDRCGSVPARWWMHPTGHHARLDEAGKVAIHRMFRWGGAGCGVVFLGCIVVVIGLARSGVRFIGS